MAHSLAEVKDTFKKYHVHDRQTGLEFIPRASISQALWDLDINPIFTDLDDVIKAQDRNGDGRIDIEEFKSFYLEMYREYATNPQRALSTFMKIDVDGDGVLTRSELENNLNDGRDDALTEEEFESFWLALDLNRSGEVCAAEFVVALCPTIDADELNAMLLAYNLPPNAKEFLGHRMKRKQSRMNKAALEARRNEEAEALRRKHEEEETRLLAEQEAKAREEEEIRLAREEQERRERSEREEAERKRREEEEKRKERERREADERRAREEKEKKAKEEKSVEQKKEEPKKEEKGGCCVTM